MITMFWRVSCDYSVLCGVGGSVWLSDEPMVYVCFGWDVCVGV